MTIFLLDLRFADKILEQHCVYSNFVLNENLKTLNSYKDNELMIVNNDLILKESQDKVNEIISKLNTKNVLSGEFNNDLTRSEDGTKHYREVGEFHNNIFIDLYSDGFELDVSQLLIDNSIKKLNSNEKDLTINAEFIGTENELFLQAYMGARQQLADYIKKEMEKEYDKFKRNFGSISEWYSLRLQKYKSRIIKWVVQQYVNYKYCNNLVSGNWRKATKNINISYDENTNWSSVFNVTYPFRNDILYDYCMVNGKKVNCVITIQITNYKDLEMILCEEVPKIIKGWTKYDRERYHLNPLLNAVDHVCKLQTPFESSGMWKGLDYFTFSFAIGFSKSGLKKYIKDNNIVPEVESEDVKDNTVFTII